VIGGASLSPAGDWTLEVAARVSEFDEFRTRFEVPIK
jgi:copper transport protein